MVLELEEVSKAYGDVKALVDVSLQVRRNRILVVLGPNGAGKTTLLKLMAGLLSPDSGRILYKGNPVNAGLSRQLRRKVTMVFQRATVFNTTVYENVAYGLKIRGLPKAEVEERVLEALEKVGIGNLRDRKARSLSGGEQQKLSLARAIALKPEVLLLDEPTVNLDPSSASAVEAFISRIKPETTLVLSTHNLFQARRLADRLAILFRGRLLEEGEASRVFSSPTHPEAARFLSGETFF
ncbi:MAG: phosphate ABC transporter ATP-binding protein [Candidatus Hecatellales archaeon]|nr:MAG: phosphate ABC transporter ATP-binding protein [Candidatus Hecatellales archaeon]